MVFGGMRSLAMTRFALLLISLAWASPHLPGQVVVSTTIPQSSLDQRWQWGLKEAATVKSRDGFWIAYSSDRLMPADRFVLAGNFHMSSSHTQLKGVPFYTLIPGGRLPSESLAGQETVSKEVVFLYRFSTRAVLEQIGMSNVSMPVDLENRPLLWLGKAPASESF